MSEQRLTRWKMTGNRFPFLYPSCKRRVWPSEFCDVSQSPDAGSPLLLTPLISPSLIFLLLSSPLLCRVMVCHLTVGLHMLSFSTDLLLERSFSLLPCCLIWSFAFLLRSTRSENVSSLTCRSTQKLNYLYCNDHVIINTLYALIKVIMIAFTQCSFFFSRIGFFWT